MLIIHVLVYDNSSFQHNSFRSLSLTLHYSWTTIFFSIMHKIYVSLKLNSLLKRISSMKTKVFIFSILYLSIPSPWLNAIHFRYSAFAKYFPKLLIRSSKQQPPAAPKQWMRVATLYVWCLWKPQLSEARRQIGSNLSIGRIWLMETQSE